MFKLIFFKLTIKPSNLISLMLALFILSFGNAFGVCDIYQYKNNYITVKQCPKGLSEKDLKNSIIISTKRISSLQDVKAIRICNYFIFHNSKEVNKQITKIKLTKNCDKNLSTKFYLGRNDKFICNIYRRNIKKERCKRNKDNYIHSGDILITTKRVYTSECDNCKLKLLNFKGSSRFGFYLYYLEKKRNLGKLGQILSLFRIIWNNYFGNEKDVYILASRGIDDSFIPKVSYVFRDDIILFPITSTDRKVIVRDVKESRVIYENEISENQEKVKIDLLDIKDLKKARKYEVSIINSLDEVSVSFYIVYPKGADELYQWIKGEVSKKRITNGELANLLCCKAKFYWRCKRFLNVAGMKGFQCEEEEN